MIRHAEIQDLTAIEAVYAHARKFMEETGNPNQWGKNHPPRATLENAIAARIFIHLLLYQFPGIIQSICFDRFHTLHIFQR